MGGSLALALRGKCAHVTGVDADAQACAAALAGQVVQAVESELHAGIANAHVLVLATPVGVILQQLQALKALTSARKAALVVLDLGWVDIGAKDRAEAESLVALGDTITVALSTQAMRNDLFTSPGLDDKVGVWTVMETLRLLKGKPLQAAVFCVSTVQEEIGLRGAATSAYGIHPTVGIAVDVCHATDTPGNEKKQLGETKLNGGPVVFRGPNINPHVHDRVVAAAKAQSITIQTRGVPKATGTDANAMQLARDGVAAGLVSIPNRYMHSPVEVVSLKDLDNAARLLAEFCASVTGEMTWIP